MQATKIKKTENGLIALIMFVGALLHSTVISFCIAQGTDSMASDAKIVFFVSIILLCITMTATICVAKKFYQIQKEK